MAHARNIAGFSAYVHTGHLHASSEAVAAPLLRCPSATAGARTGVSLLRFRARFVALCRLLPAPEAGEGGNPVKSTTSGSDSPAPAAPLPEPAVADRAPAGDPAPRAELADAALPDPDPEPGPLAAPLPPPEGSFRLEGGGCLVFSPLTPRAAAPYAAFVASAASAGHQRLSRIRRSAASAAASLRDCGGTPVGWVCGSVDTATSHVPCSTANLDRQVHDHCQQPAVRPTIVQSESGAGILMPTAVHAYLQALLRSTSHGGPACSLAPRIHVSTAKCLVVHTWGGEGYMHGVTAQDAPGPCHETRQPGARR